MKTHHIFLISVFCSILNIRLHAQAPGDINDFKVWQKEFGFFNHDEYNSSLFNYHPYRQFDDDGGYHKIKLDEFDKISIYTVFSSEDHNTMGVINSLDGSIAITDSSVISTSKVGYESKMHLPKILFYAEHLGEKPKKQKKDLASFIVGDRYYSDRKFKGGIAEVLLYDRILNTSEKQKIASYLSMKYGISLPDTSTYYSSSGKSIFIPGDEYRHFTTCIGRDDASGLYQKQSHNGYDEIDLQIGLNSIEKMNQDNQSEIKDQSFLFWSNNEDKPSRNKNEINKEISKSWQMIANDESFSGKLMHLRIGLLYDKREAIFLVKKEIENEDVQEWIPMKYNDEKKAFECKFIFDKDMSKQALFSFKKLEKENESSVGSSLYPNPVTEQDEFYITNPCEKDETFTCNIYLATGELVKSEKINCLSDTQVYRSKLYKEGAYIIEIVRGDIKTSHKLIVIKK